LFSGRFRHDHRQRRQLSLAQAAYVVFAALHELRPEHNLIGLLLRGRGHDAGIGPLQRQFDMLAGLVDDVVDQESGIGKKAFQRIPSMRWLAAGDTAQGRG